MEDKNKRLADTIQEITYGVSCHEKTESNNPGPTVGNADKVSKSSIVSSCKKTRNNALPPTSTTVYGKG